MLVQFNKELADKCETIMDVVPKDATENNTEFKNATQLMADLIQLGDTGYNLIDITIAKDDKRMANETFLDINRLIFLAVVFSEDDIGITDYDDHRTVMNKLEAKTTQY